jgi:hypothetical protein
MLTLMNTTALHHTRISCAGRTRRAALQTRHQHVASASAGLSNEMKQLQSFAIHLIGTQTQTRTQTHDINYAIDISSNELHIPKQSALFHKPIG